MEIIKIKIDEITPYKNNAKIHTNEQIEQIKKINRTIWNE